MTLILSEVSCLGVAMAADSAVRIPSGRVYVGAQKLLPVYQIDAGLSLWGRAEINGVDADVWLQQFIDEDVKGGMRLWNMAENLAKRLQEAFGGVIRDRLGVHVGGFDLDEESGVRGPALYHVHNGHYHVGIRNGKVVEIPDEDPPIREFRAERDFPPAIYRPTDRPLLLQNGDFLMFALLYKKIVSILEDFQRQTDFRFPDPALLKTRGEYLRFWINMVKEIYRLSNKQDRTATRAETAGHAAIGGPVTVLTISDGGIQSFYSR